MQWEPVPGDVPYCGSVHMLVRAVIDLYHLPHTLELCCTTEVNGYWGCGQFFSLTVCRLHYACSNRYGSSNQKYSYTICIIYYACAHLTNESKWAVLEYLLRLELPYYTCVGTHLENLNIFNIKYLMISF